MNRLKTSRAALLFFLALVLFACSGQNVQPSVTNISSTAPLNDVPTATQLPSSTPTIKPWVYQSEVEVVTNKAAVGDGGNNWGGHQSRIVHTQDGVFTAYTVDGSGPLSRNWKLVQKQVNGSWNVVAEGIAGREPVNLLASPDGTLHIIGWPNGVGTMWSGKPNNGALTMTAEKIPNVASGNWPYSSAGTDENGDLCILSSVGGEASVGWFKWACYIPSKSQWISQTSELDYRFAYTYVLPKPDGQLSLVSTRDVLWSALGYKQPTNTFEYVFNAFGYWRTNDSTTEPIQLLSFAEEVPTEQYPAVLLSAQVDAYLDTKDRMHILYTLLGSNTRGDRTVRHRIIAYDGKTVIDEEIPEEAGGLVRIFQDKNENFYLLCESGLLYPMDEEGIKLKRPIKLDFGRYQVEYSGFGISVPRTGTSSSNVIDVVFPSSNGAAWIYFQLDFSRETANSNFQPTKSPVLNNATQSAGSFQTMVENAQVLFTADLSDPTMAGWDWWDDRHSAITTENGTLIFNKDPSGGAQLRSQYGLKDNEACLALFKYGGTDFSFQATAGDWRDSTWRVWGITGAGTDVFNQLGQDFTSESLGLKKVPDHWYYNLLWVKGPTTFVVRIWDQAEPQLFVEKQVQINEPSNWVNRVWNCHLFVESGTVEMGSYQELRFNQTP